MPWTTTNVVQVFLYSYYSLILISAGLRRNQKLQFSIQLQIADKLYNLDCAEERLQYPLTDNQDSGMSNTSIPSPAYGRLRAV